MRLLLWLLIGGPIAVVIIALAMLNNQPVTILLDPVTPQAPLIQPLTVPLYGVFFVMLMIGVAIGGLATWAGQGRFRRAARVNRKDALRWRTEAEKLREETQPAISAPALPVPRKAA
ncbi:hypothetical protein HDIA_3702 [Hartmannibacter diazotrophicus]|uniref:Uncharacterized protein n=1 Tax=Hartmannibacter diazotrophicus TaxID=1482074 RepID=A0A2C9DAI1_9HYPH|nr:hypothetical protein [Hartmannibacter diazotrophicus]SON57243.1 hypothetical protein HDIA_3702 [Hartmannibacter diazotrophicus]